MATASHKCIATPLNTQSNETESGPPHRGRFRCDVCQLEFPYKSKYERHLTTIKHNENYQLANSTPGTHHNSDTEDMEASMLVSYKFYFVVSIILSGLYRLFQLMHFKINMTHLFIRTMNLYCLVNVIVRVMKMLIQMKVFLSVRQIIHVHTTIM